jgi:cell division protein ZapA (FtsZ GTPase activity inhibitor)
MLIEHIVHLGVNWSYVDVDNVEFVGGLSVADEKLREIEKNTRIQSECDRWFEERSQIFTT